MKSTNEIMIVKGGYRLVNGNAQSTEIFTTLDKAELANEADMKAWHATDDANEAEENSPIIWE